MLNTIGKWLGVVPHGTKSAKKAAPKAPEAPKDEPRDELQREWTVLYLGDLDATKKLPKYFATARQMKADNSVEFLAQTSHDGKVTRERLGTDESETLDTEPFSAQSIQDFLSWGVKKYPANRYAVVLNAHSRGYEGIFGTAHSSALETPEIAGAIEKAAQGIPGKKFDAVISASCFSASTEVAYEMKEGAHFYAGSEDVLPDTAFRLENLGEVLKSQPIKPTEELMKDLVAKMSEGSAISFSAVDLEKVGELRKPLKDFKAAMGESDFNARDFFRTIDGQVARANSDETNEFFYGDKELTSEQRYSQATTTRYRTIGGLADFIAETTPDVKDAAEKVSEGLADAVIAKHTKDGWMPMSGLTIHAALFNGNQPRAKEVDYSSFEIHQDTGWDGLLS